MTDHAVDRLADLATLAIGVICVVIGLTYKAEILLVLGGTLAGMPVKKPGQFLRDRRARKKLPAPPPSPQP